MHDGPTRQRPGSRGRKIIRRDPSPEDDSEYRGGAERAGLLDQFRRWLSRPPQEGRRATRHAARMYIVWLGWWQAEREFFALTARLSNISRGGALIVVQRPPPENHPVWICLGTAEPEECLAATTLEVRTARRGECTIRLAFHEPCPSRFLEAAVCGRTSQRAGVGHSLG